MKILKCFFFLSLLINISCSEISEPNSRIKDKNEPSDEYLNQRMDRNGKFHADVYEKSVKIARRMEQENTARSSSGNWEVQGPGNIGARVNTVAVHPENDLIMFAGFANGGLWKTQSGGIGWKPVFDDHDFLAISDVVFNPLDPQVMYAGTGDGNITGFSFLGDGIYKSVDGGESWKNCGLGDQKVVSEIIVNPVDTNIVYAATMGLFFTRSEERGLYKSMDGGINWSQILYVSDSTGIIDIAMDPSNPEVIYAASWDRIRNDEFSVVQGETCKVFKTINGGTDWIELTNGLPMSNNGRIGLDINQNYPNVIHAVYTDDESFFKGIYRSNDSGASWEEIPSLDLAGVFGGFGWYFSKIRTNPYDPDDIFVLGIDLFRKQGLDAEWDRAAPPWWRNDVHADKHDLYIDPNSLAMYLATDGGVYKGSIENDTWIDIENIPTTQFYEVAFNPHDPDLYYGGAQDNGTTGGNKDGINEWERIYGGDGFRTVFNPDNSFSFFVSTQRGGIHYTNDGGLSFDEGNGFDDDESTNWNTPFFMSTFDSKIMYAGRQRVYKSESFSIPYWEAISDVLTDEDDENKLSKTLSSVNESPLLQHLLYAGGSDGSLHRLDSIDGEWISINDELPEFNVYSIEPSHDFEDHVFVSLSGYKSNVDAPMIFYSQNRGDDWNQINGDLPPVSLNDIFVMPNYQDSVLFAASDVGVYFTKDLGEHWERLGTDMPFIPVFDLELNPIKNELIAGTFGRSIMTFNLDQIEIFSDYVPVSTKTAQDFKIERLKIFPNPADDQINIQFSNTEKGKSISLVIFDAKGSLIESMKIEEDGFQDLSVNVEDYVAGQYFVKIKFRHTILSGSFIKQ